MTGIVEVKEEYKQAARDYIRHINDEDSGYHAGKFIGVKRALICLGVDNNELNEMYFANEEEVQNEWEPKELDATERPVSQARVEGKTAKTTAKYRRLAYQYEEQAKWGKALEYYNKAIEAYPKVTGPLAESDLDALKEKSEGIANFIKAEEGGETIR